MEELNSLDASSSHHSRLSLLNFHHLTIELNETIKDKIHLVNGFVLRFIVGFFVHIS